MVAWCVVSACSATVGGTARAVSAKRGGNAIADSARPSPTPSVLSSVVAGAPVEQVSQAPWTQPPAALMAFAGAAARPLVIP